MTRRVFVFIRVFFASIVFYLLFITPLSASAACNPTQIINPPDGQNFVSPLPFRITPIYNTGVSNSGYYLDLYKGVPGSSRLINRHSQGFIGCTTNFSAVNQDILNENGDYFYVLYSTNSINFSSWTSFWANGAGYSSSMPNYAISRFSIASSRTPVILVPGIGASMNLDVLLKNKSSNNWSFFGSEGPYSGLLKSLESVGYQRNKDLFVAFYDWRKSNDINEDTNGNSVDGYLIPVIDKAKVLCQCQKIAIVAHSMGGLLARSYVQSDEYLSRNDVSQLFLVGTPNRGSSDVYTLWEGGHIPKNWTAREKIGILAYSWFLSEDKLKGNTDRERYFTIRNNVFSVRQLLPVFDYLNFNNVLLSFLGMQEQNPFLLNLNRNMDLLSSRVKLYTVVGKDQPTVNDISIISRLEQDAPLWADGMPEPPDPIRNDVNGDTRVLVSSAELGNVIKNYVFSADHGKILELAESPIAQAMGFRIQGDFPSKYYANALLYAVASPADIAVSDPNGNIFDKNQNAIPGAYYFSETDPSGGKIILIENPIPGDYEITLRAVGDGGEYHIFAGNFSEGNDAVTTAAKGTITQNQTMEYTSSYNPEGGDNAITLEQEDRDPPIIAVFSPEQKNYLRSDKPLIEVSVIDEGSGVAFASIKLDGIIKENGEAIDLFFLKLGGHTLEVEAKDNAGNETRASVNFENIATIQSTILDVERAFGLGWITKKNVAKNLVKNLQKLAKAKKPKQEARAIKNFLKELYRAEGKQMNDEAYRLLLEDIDWIQTH